MFAAKLASAKVRAAVSLCGHHLLEALSPEDVSYEGHSFSFQCHGLQVWIMVAAAPAPTPPAGEATPALSTPDSAPSPALTPAAIAPSGPTDPRAALKLSPLERALFLAATHEPATAKQLARKIGKSKANTRIYEALRSLCRRDLLEKTFDGYRRHLGAPACL